jgi:hypothetical protein
MKDLEEGEKLQEVRHNKVQVAINDEIKPRKIK